MLAETVSSTRRRNGRSNKRMRRICSAAFSCSRIPRSAVGAGLLLDGEHPDHAALGHVVFETDVVGRQRIRDALRVNTPADWIAIYSTPCHLLLRRRLAFPRCRSWSSAPRAVRPSWHRRPGSCRSLVPPAKMSSPAVAVTEPNNCDFAKMHDQIFVPGSDPTLALHHSDRRPGAP